MQSEKFEMYDCLINWIKVLKVPAQETQEKMDLSDGVIFAQALNQIDPDMFTDVWLSKIKTDVGSNWRLKVSNLKKIVDAVFEYYSDNLQYSSLPIRPDLMKIVENNDQVELGRLLQLILGCAVNCANKQQYITQIMELEEILQRNIMRALQDIEQGSTPRSSMSGSQDIKVMQDEKEVMLQKCHEADKKIAILHDEKVSMQQEILKLQYLVDKYENPNIIGDDGASLGPVQLGSTRYNDLRKQVDLLKDELLQAETARDDLKMKSSQQEAEMVTMQAKIDELNLAAAELSQLKDEMDALQESSDKLKIYENQISTYKKKMEDYNDLKKQIKLLEERSADYIKQNIQFEDDAKKFAGLKGQVELYKKEIQDLHAKLDTEMSKTTKIEFEMNVLQTRLTAVQREKDSLLSERDALRETCDELRCRTSEGNGDTISKELQSPDLKEKLERLLIENKALREGQGGQTALAQLLDDSNQRMEKLREQLKAANQKILQLSSQTPNESEQTPRSGDLQLRTALDEAQNQISNLHGKVAQVETSLAAREQELILSETRYKKCIEKAKEVIKTLDPRLAAEPTLIEKPIETENEMHRPTMGPVEERLIVSAFYRLGLASQREVLDGRLALLSGPGQSFLARQRQPAARKPLSMKK